MLDLEAREVTSFMMGEMNLLPPTMEGLAIFKRNKSWRSPSAPPGDT